MRFRWAIVTLSMLGVGFAGPVAAENLRIGLTATVKSTETASGYGAVAPAGLDGFNTDIADELCRRLNATCLYTSLPFGDIIPAVSKGTLDIGIANTLKTPDRMRQVLFTMPYWRSTSSFVGKTGQSLPEPTTLLVSDKVCAIGGSRQEAYLLALPGATGKSVLPALSNQKTLEGLRDGTCSLAFVPTMQALPFLQSAEGGGFAFRGLPFMDDGLGGDVHMIVAPAKPALLKKVDEALAALIRDGTHERISRRYFPFSIL